MSRKILIFILTFTWIFLFPMTALAGSCQCVYTHPSFGGQSRTACFATDPAQTPYNSTTCIAKIGTTDPTLNYYYSSCNYFDSNNCTTPGTISGYCKCGISCLAAPTGNCDSTAGIGGTCTFCTSSDCKTGCALASQTPTPVANQPKITPLNLEIGIPGLPKTLTNGSIDTQGNVQIPFLGQYVAAVYKFSVIAASLVAVVVIILGGFQITISAGGEGKAAGLKRVVRSLTGLFILWSSYLLLYTINPNLTTFKPISIKYVDPVPLQDVQAGIDAASTAKGSIATCTGYSDEALNSSGIDPKIITAAKNAKIDPLILAVIFQKESNTTNWRRGPCGEVGPTQLMPSTVDGLYGGLNCCTASTRAKYGSCPETAVTPDYFLSANGDKGSFTCQTNICGHCEQASASCINYFSGDNGPTNSYNLSAKYINQYINKSTGGDLATTFAGYNGKGPQALEYARDAAVKYNAYCQQLKGK